MCNVAKRASRLQSARAPLSLRRSAGPRQATPSRGCVEQVTRLPAGTAGALCAAPPPALARRAAPRSAECFDRLCVIPRRSRLRWQARRHAFPCRRQLPAAGAALASGLTPCLPVAGSLQSHSYASTSQIPPDSLSGSSSGTAGLRRRRQPCGRRASWWSGSSRRAW